MDPKFDIKQTISVLYRFYLPYQQPFLYRLELDKGETPFIDKRFDKNVDKNVDKLSISNAVLISAGIW